MIDLAQIYLCSHCGEVDGYPVEDIDIENDEVHEYMACAKCNREVRPKIENGAYCYRKLSERELNFLMDHDLGEDDDPYL